MALSSRLFLLSADDGLLDIERFTSQQFARVDDPFAPARPAPGTGSSSVDAASRFIARSGSWEPDQPLLPCSSAAHAAMEPGL